MFYEVRWQLHGYNYSPDLSRSVGYFDSEKKAKAKARKFTLVEPDYFDAFVLSVTKYGETELLAKYNQGKEI